MEVTADRTAVVDVDSESVYASAGDDLFHRGAQLVNRAVVDRYAGKLMFSRRSARVTVAGKLHTTWERCGRIFVAETAQPTRHAAGESGAGRDDLRHNALFHLANTDALQRERCGTATYAPVTVRRYRPHPLGSSANSLEIIVIRSKSCRSYPPGH